MLLSGLYAAPVFGADWVEYRSGPFHVFSDAGDRHAREALTQLEQLRFVLGATLGGASSATLGTRELTPVWPINLILFAHQKDYAPHALPMPLVDGGASTLAAWSADVGKDTELPHDLLRAITERLIEDNSARLPQEIETGLGDLLATLQLKDATKVYIGAPLASGEISGDRLRMWAKLQMLTTQPEFAGKLRVYLNNLQQTSEEDAASRNAFDMTAAKLKERADAYFRAGKFEAAPVSGKAIAPNRDFIEKEVAKTKGKTGMEDFLAELDAQGRTFSPGSPRALLAENTLESLDAAAESNKRWAEPYVKMAALENDTARKIADLKKAASLAPRNPDYSKNRGTPPNAPRPRTRNARASTKLSSNCRTSVRRSRLPSANSSWRKKLGICSASKIPPPPKCTLPSEPPTRDLAGIEATSQIPFRTPRRVLAIRKAPPFPVR